MKKYLISLLCLFVFAASAQADDLAKANKLFEDNMYQQAVDAFLPLLNSKNKDTRYQAQIKTVLALGKLNKYDAAARALYSYPVPSDKLWKARYYLVKINVLSNLSYYSATQLQEMTDDPAKFTYQQRQKAKKESYKELWDMRTSLANMPTEESLPYLRSYEFFSRKNLVLEPTLFDYLLQKWNQYDIKPYAEILEEAYKIGGKDREAVAEIWHIDRVILDLNNKTAALEYLAGYNTNYQIPEEIKKVIFQPKEILAKAYAAYLASSDYLQDEEYTKAINVADYCLGLKLNYYSDDCSKIRERVLDKDFNVFSPSFNTAAGENAKLKVMARNLDKVYINIYTLNTAFFEANNKNRPMPILRGKAKQQKAKADKTWTTNPYYTVPEITKGRKPAKTLGVTFNYPQNYEPIETDIEIPYIKDGLFAVIFSKTQEPQENDKVVYLNFTDIATAVTGYSAKTSKGSRLNYFNIYALNAKTGALKPNVKVFGWDFALKTKNDGQVQVNIPKNKNALSVLAQNYGNNAIVPDIYFNIEEQSKYKIILNSDRAIYRPGQEVKFAATVIEYNEPNYTVYSGKRKLSLDISSANGKSIAKTSLALDGMGSATYNFTLPKDITLGQFYVKADIEKENEYLWLNVEDFKQPDFEVILNKPQENIAFGRMVNLDGKAQYYFGNPVQKGKVTYSINRNYFIPWFLWWEGQYPSTNNPIAQGTAKLDKEGNFKISFKPENEPKYHLLPFNYTVTVNVTDEGGRTITTKESFKVSGREYYFIIKNEKGFFRAGVQSSIDVKMVNVDEQPLEGSATAKVYAAILPDDYFSDDEVSSPFRVRKVSPRDTVNKDSEQIKEGAMITSFPVKFTKNGPTAVAVPPLEEGYYLIKITTTDSQGVENDSRLLFTVINLKDPKIKLKNKTLMENKTYYPGETAVIVLGSEQIDANKYIEVYKDQYLRQKKTLNKKGIAVFELPITKADQGGISLNWFSIYNYKSYNGSLNIPVAFINKKLNVKIHAQAQNLPGSKVDWDLTAEDENGKPVNGRAIVTVYDKSLDYYKSHSLNMPNPYKDLSNMSNPVSTSFDRSYSFFGGYAVRSAVARKSMPVMESANSYDGMDLDLSPSSDSGGGANEPQIRKDFAPTAFFGPQLNIKDGIAKFNFTLPQRLTQWAVLAAAFTKDLKTGKAALDVRTSKDLMLRIEAPRFLRENDKIDLKTLVTNNTDIDLPVTVDFLVKLNGDDAAALTGLNKIQETLSVPAHTQKVLSWNIKAPVGTGLFEVTAVARAGGLSDGEQKDFPLLPSAQRLMQSEAITVKDGDNKIALDDLASKDISVDALHLQVDPTLLMPVLNAMPMLVKNPSDTIFGALDNYLPIAVFNKMYTKYPQLREAAAKLKTRQTLQPAWAQEDNMLFKELAQTPWYTLSQGYGSIKNSINIFDAKLVAQQQLKTLKALPKFQNEDGGFAWLEGGRSSSFITLRVLENFATARRYGVSVPQEAAQKAIKYIEKNVKLDEDPSYGNLSFNLYMAYVLTSFPKDWYTTDVAALLDKAAKFDSYLLPLGKAYMASVYNRLGKDTDSKIYLAMLFDGATTDPVTGTTWMMEERSWQWFNDSLTLHTTALQVLSEINPQDPRIDGLVQWIIFNKKANQWGNAQAAAQAVYALVDIMERKSAFNQIKVFNIDWGAENQKLIAKPQDLFEESFTLSKYNEAAEPAYFKAAITKSTINEADGTKALSLNDFASMTALFTSSTPQKAAPKGLMNIEKQFFLVEDKGVKQLRDGATVKVGDEIQVRLTISAQSEFSFVMVNDPKPAGFEADDLLSGWRWTDTLPRYEEQRDSLTNFFFDSIPNGTYELKYTIRPTAAGSYNVGASVMQSMFAPEFATHSAGFKINVK